MEKDSFQESLSDLRISTDRCSLVGNNFIIRDTVKLTTRLHVLSYLELLKMVKVKSSIVNLGNSLEGIPICDNLEFICSPSEGSSINYLPKVLNTLEIKPLDFSLNFIGNFSTNNGLTLLKSSNKTLVNCVIESGNFTLEDINSKNDIISTGKGAYNNFIKGCNLFCNKIIGSEVGSFLRISETSAVNISVIGFYIVVFALKPISENSFIIFKDCDRLEVYHEKDKPNNYKIVLDNIKSLVINNLECLEHNDYRYASTLSYSIPYVVDLDICDKISPIDKQVRPLIMCFQLKYLDNYYNDSFNLPEELRGRVIINTNTPIK